MTEEQVPLMVLIAFLGGCIAGAWAGRWSPAGAALLLAVITMDVAGWMTYGFIVNWEPSWGAQKVIASSLYVGCGMIIFAAVPAVAGYGIGAYFSGTAHRRAERRDTGKRT